MKFVCLLCGNDKSVSFEPDLEVEGWVTEDGSFQIEMPSYSHVTEIIRGQVEGGLLCGVCRNHLFIMNEDEEEKSYMSKLMCRECGGEEFITRLFVDLDGSVTDNGNIEVSDITESMIQASIRAVLDEGSILLQCANDKCVSDNREYKLKKVKGGSGDGALLSAV